MAVILVVEPDQSFAQRLDEALKGNGWSIAILADREAALSRAAQQAPDLVLVDSAVPGATELLAKFAARAGGPGSMVLVPSPLGARKDAADFRADALITKPFSDDDLRDRVRNWLTRDALPDGSDPTATDDRLNSRELFADILAEVEADFDILPERAAELDPASERMADAAIRAHGPRIDADLERKLEETLSGVMAAPDPTQSAPATRRSAARARAAEEVDQMLDQTLGDLSLRARRTSPRPAVPPVPGSAISVLDEGDALATQPIPIMPVESGDRFGDYQLRERIAVGGMAEVWRAQRRGVEGFEKAVAIKKILAHLGDSPDFITMFVDEAKLAAQLNHNNITQIYDLGKVGDDFFIAMELIDGMDLRSILQEARRLDLPLPVGQALSITAQLARALDYAHRKRDFEGNRLNLVHRDVSPQNVLISNEGEIKLCDFGIARAVSKVGNTQMGMLKGKLQYMSPEQAWGRTVDARTDIFSLGAVLFEMLTGSKLFSGDSEIAVLDAVRDCHVPPLRALRSEIPEAVESIVLQALAKDPDGRYATAGDMAQALDDSLEAFNPSPSELAGYVQNLAATTSQGQETPTEPPAPTPTPAPTPSAAPEVPAEATVTPEIEDDALEAPPTGDEAVSLSDSDSESAYEEVRPNRRTGLWLVIAALLLVAAAAAFWWFGIRNSGSETPAPTLATPSPSSPTPPATTLPTSGDTDGRVGIDPVDTTVPEDPEGGSRQDADDGGQTAAVRTDDGAESEPVASAEQAADGAADGEDTVAPSVDSAPATGETPAAALDIEQLVNDEMERRAAQLREDFERERRLLEADLAKAQETAQDADGEDATPPPPAGEGEGDGPAPSAGDTSSSAEDDPEPAGEGGGGLLSRLSRHSETSILANPDK